MHQPVAAISRPVVEFRGFRSIALEPGETGTAVLALGDDDLAYWHPDGRHATDPGRFDILTGPDAATLQAVSLELQP